MFLAYDIHSLIIPLFSNTQLELKAIPYWPHLGIRNIAWIPCNNMRKHYICIPAITYPFQTIQLKYFCRICTNPFIRLLQHPFVHERIVSFLAWKDLTSYEICLKWKCWLLGFKYIFSDIVIWDICNPSVIATLPIWNRLWSFIETQSTWNRLWML